MQNLRQHASKHFIKNKISSLNFIASDKTHNVCGCPCYMNGLSNGLPFHTTLQRPYNNKYTNHTPSSSERTNYNISVFRFFITSLAKSSINGISNSTSTGNLIGRLIWIIVFIGCLSGFLYQASHFYRLYKTNPTVVQIEVENDGEVDFPAVTVCNTNR